MANTTTEVIRIAFEIISKGGAAKGVEKELANIQRILQNTSKLPGLDLSQHFKGVDTPAKLAAGVQGAIGQLKDFITQTSQASKVTPEMTAGLKEARTALGALETTLINIRGSSSEVGSAFRDITLSQVKAATSTKELNAFLAEQSATTKRLASEVSNLEAISKAPVAGANKEQIQAIKQELQAKRELLAQQKELRTQISQSVKDLKVQKGSVDSMAEGFINLRNSVRKYGAQLTDAEQRFRASAGDPKALKLLSTEFRNLGKDVNRTLSNITGDINKLQNKGQSAFGIVRESANRTQQQFLNLRQETLGLQSNIKSFQNSIKKVSSEVPLENQFKSLRAAAQEAFAGVRREFAKTKTASGELNTDAIKGFKSQVDNVNKVKESLSNLRDAAQKANNPKLVNQINSAYKKVDSVLGTVSNRLNDLQARADIEPKIKKSQAAYTQLQSTVQALGKEFSRFSQLNQPGTDRLLGGLDKATLGALRQELKSLQSQVTATFRDAGRQITATQSSADPALRNLSAGFKSIQDQALSLDHALQQAFSRVAGAERTSTPLTQLQNQLPALQNMALTFRDMTESGAVMHRVLFGAFNFLQRATGRSNEGILQLGHAVGQLERDMVRFRSGVVTFSLGLLFLGQTIIQPFQKGLSITSEFSDSMGVVRAVTNATAREFEDLTRIAQDLGATTRFTANEAAKGLEFLGRAGFSASDALRSIGTTLNLAQAAAEDLGKTADVVTNIMTTFEQTADNLPITADVLTKAFTTSNSTLTELGHAFKFVGGVAKGLDADFEDLAGATALLHNAGLKSTLAGTALRGALNRLLNPTKENARLLKDMSDRLGGLGFQITDAGGKFVGFTQLVKQFEDAGATSAEILQLFGQRAGPGMAALIRIGSDRLEEYVETLKLAEGTTERIAKTMEETLRGRILQANSAVEALALQFGENLEPTLKGILGVFADIANRVHELREALGPITVVFDHVVTGAALLTVVLGTLAASWFLMLVPARQFLAMLNTFVGALAVTTGSFFGLTTAQTAASAATTKQTAALAALNTTIATNLGLTAAQTAAVANQIKTQLAASTALQAAAPTLAGTLKSILVNSGLIIANFARGIGERVVRTLTDAVGIAAGRTNALSASIAASLNRLKAVAASVRNSFLLMWAALLNVSTGIFGAVVSGLTKVANAARNAALAFTAMWLALVRGFQVSGVSGIVAVLSTQLDRLIKWIKGATAGLILMAVALRSTSVAAISLTGVLKGLGAILFAIGRFFLANPIGLAIVAIGVALAFINKPLAVTNAELDRQKGLIAAVRSEVGLLTGSMKKSFAEIERLTRSGTITQEDRLRLQRSLVEDAVTLGERLSELGDKFINIEVNVDDDGNLENIDVILTRTNERLELFNRNMLDASDADTFEKINKQLTGLYSTIQKESAAQVEIITDQQAKQQIGSLVRIKRELTNLEGGFTPFTTDEEAEKKQLSLINERFKIEENIVKLLNLKNKSEKERAEILARITADLRKHPAEVQDVINKDGVLLDVSTRITKTIEDQNKSVDLLEKGILDAAKAAEELSRVPVSQVILKWSATMKGFGNDIQEALKGLKAELKDLEGELDDVLEVDEAELKHNLQILEDELDNEIQAVENASNEKLQILLTSVKDFEDAQSLEAQIVRESESEKLDIINKNARKRIDVVNKFLSRQRILVEGLKSKEFELNEELFDQQRDILVDQISATNKAYDQLLSAKEKLNQRLIDLDKDRRDFEKDVEQELIDFQIAQFEKEEEKRVQVAEEGIRSLRKTRKERRVERAQRFAEERTIQLLTTKFQQKEAEIRKEIAKSEAAESTEARISALNTAKEATEELQEIAKRIAGQLDPGSFLDQARLKRLFDTTSNLQKAVVEDLKDATKDEVASIEQSLAGLKTTLDSLNTTLRELSTLMAQVFDAKRSADGINTLEEAARNANPVVDEFLSKIEDLGEKLANDLKVGVDREALTLQIREAIGAIETELVQLETRFGNLAINTEDQLQGVVSPQAQEELAEFSQQFLALRQQLLDLSRGELDLAEGLNLQELVTLSEGDRLFDQSNKIVDIVKTMFDKLDNLKTGFNETKLQLVDPATQHFTEQALNRLGSKTNELRTTFFKYREAMDRAARGEVLTGEQAKQLDIAEAKLESLRLEILQTRGIDIFGGLSAAQLVNTMRQAESSTKGASDAIAVFGKQITTSKDRATEVSELIKGFEIRDDALRSIRDTVDLMSGLSSVVTSVSSKFTDASINLTKVLQGIEIGDEPPSAEQVDSIRQALNKTNSAAIAMDKELTNLLENRPELRSVIGEDFVNEINKLIGLVSLSDQDMIEFFNTLEKGGEDAEKEFKGLTDRLASVPAQIRTLEAIIGKLNAGPLKELATQKFKGTQDELNRLIGFFEGNLKRLGDALDEDAKAIVQNRVREAKQLLTEILRLTGQPLEAPDAKDIKLDVDDSLAISALQGIGNEFDALKAKMEQGIKVPITTSGTLGAKEAFTLQELKSSGGLIAPLQKAIGGLIPRIQKFAEGGINQFKRLPTPTVPGVGTGDKVPALLEPGEYVVRRSVVKQLGVRFMELLNSGVLQLKSAGGLINEMPSSVSSMLTSLQRTPIRMMQGGGLVTTSPAGVTDRVEVVLNVGDQGKFSVFGDRDTVRNLTSALRQVKKGGIR